MEKLERQARAAKRSLEAEQKLEQFKSKRVSKQDIWFLLELGCDPENENNPNQLNSWEWKFIQGIRNKLKQYPALTTRQRVKFTQIYEKYQNVSLSVLRARKRAERLEFARGKTPVSNSEDWNDLGSL